ncbi:MAG: ribbon-helix-helix protein, CopG family [SAR324 cluster bacterium]|nr:ribbon-helix-helix protein, CopG family [SAR324 cluster bacterium]
MVRTQIQLTEDQARLLRELALAGNESVAALIRKAIDRFLVTGKPNRAAQYRQALSLAGKYKTEKSDTAVEHDRYLEEAFGS